MQKPELFNESHQATYCPEDDKLRLYVGRVPRDEYEALRAEGWTCTPKQACNFVAVWTPNREDTALSYAGFIGDEDQEPGDRAADRAERFTGYLGRRLDEAGAAADTYDAGPAAHGYQDANRAERAAARHDRQAAFACSQWEKAEYWTRRTAGVIAHALYVSGPGVRMGRIKKLEAEQRKAEADHEDYARRFRLWSKVLTLDDPAEAFKLAYALANSAHCCPYDYRHPRPATLSDYQREHGTSLYSLLTHDPDPITGHEAARLWLSDASDPANENGIQARRRRHYARRLDYERQMLEAQGGRACSLDMEPGGWLGNRQIQAVHKSPATGRVVSVKVWGTTTGYTKESGYTRQETRPCLVSKNIERLPPGSYRAPTDEERAAFNAEKAAKKAAAPVVPLINPTLDDARRLQDILNARAAEADKGKNYPRKAGAVDEQTQAEYSASCPDWKAVQVHFGVKVRMRTRCWQNVESVVVLTDKPQKPLPVEWPATVTA